MNHHNRKNLINGSERLTTTNSSILLESHKGRTLREMVNWLGVLKNYFDFPDYIYDETCWILDHSWPYYRQLSNQIVWESFVIASMILAFEIWDLEIQRDIYSFVKECFTKEGFADIMNDINWCHERLNEYFN